MTNSNSIENDFKIMLISLPLLTLLSLMSIVYKTKGFQAVDAPRRHNVSYSALPKGALGFTMVFVILEISLDMKREELEEAFMKTLQC